MYFLNVGEYKLTLICTHLIIRTLAHSQHILVKKETFSTIGKSSRNYMEEGKCGDIYVHIIYCGIISFTKLMYNAI